MQESKEKSQLSIIYWGTLISSLGTFTFPGATVGILTQMNFPLWKIGGVMALSRLGTLTGSFMWGDLSDRFDAKKTVIITEAVAFLISALLMISWSFGEQGFGYFAFFTLLRFVVISIGGPGKNKMVKSLSEKYKKSHFHSAITLNTVTYGPGVLGSLLGFFAIKYFSFYWVLGFDAFTFIVNGALLLLLVSEKSLVSHPSPGIFHKLKVYFSHRRLALFDVLLAVPFMGTNVLMSRLSGGIGYRVPLLLATFGFGAILSAALFRWKPSRISHFFAYFSLFVSFAILRGFRTSFILIAGAVTLRNISYWYLFNLYTGSFQTKEPGQSVAALFAARAFVGTLILGVGEIIIGIIGDYYSLDLDLAIRASLTFLILILSARINYVEAT